MHRAVNNASSNGYILIQTSPEDDVRELAEVITRTPGVVRVERVHGPYDVIAVTHETDGMDSSPAHEISKLDGVLRAIPLTIASPPRDARSSAGEAA